MQIHYAACLTISLAAAFTLGVPAHAQTADSILANKKIQNQPPRPVVTFETPHIGAHKKVRQLDPVQPEIVQRPCRINGQPDSGCRFEKH